MKIGVLGTGNIGSTLGKLWARKGHDVTFGSRNPGKAEQLATIVGNGSQGGSYDDACRFGTAVLLAVPWSVALETVKKLDLDSKILIDPTNPLIHGELEVGHVTSAAEMIQDSTKNAYVVKAFNSIYYKTFEEPEINGVPASSFLCGDDAVAKETVSQLSIDIGLDPVDAGPLSAARLLEPLAFTLDTHGVFGGTGKRYCLGVAET